MGKEEDNTIRTMEKTDLYKRCPEQDTRNDPRAPCQNTGAEPGLPGGNLGQIFRLPDKSGMHTNLSLGSQFLSL